MSKYTHALRFILLIGLISLFADITYEGARSIFGPFFLSLGVSGAFIGVVMGLGELVGYGARLISGYLTDKTQQYWVLTWVGYTINLVAIPLLAFVDQPTMAALLIILERLGKAIRSPARDTILSYATAHLGRGLGFGIHESMDRIGALTGPLLLSAILFWKQSFHLGFALLAIPAALALISLAIARSIYPRPQDMEPSKHTLRAQGLNANYWTYLTAIGLVAAGYVDFALIAFHFDKTSLIPVAGIPFIYALAMGVDGLASLLIGKWFDKKGWNVLLLATLIAAFSAPLAFLSGLSGAILGMILWGIGLGTQQSVMRGLVAHLVPPHRRGSAYGWLNLSFGLFWFLGSALMGVLYDLSPLYLALFSSAAQLGALPLLLIVKRRFPLQ